jgi:uncharacterized protein YwqG
MAQNDKIKELAEQLKSLSKTEYYRIKIIPNITPDIFDSKYGGLPYWTPDKNYPTNSEGEKLILLALINFDREKVDSPLPTSGMLQFFITDDDIMGVDYENPTKQNNFRVIYHETINYNITKEEIEKLNIPNSNEKTVECFPITKECKISLNKGVDYITYGDIHFEDFFPIAYKEVFKKEPKKEITYINILENDERNRLDHELGFSKSSHKMLGYSFFTQDDPRYDKKYRDYDTLLLQIDSQGDYVLWGDCGVGNFFIPKKSLLEKDFSDVLYNWDCS